MPLKPTLVLSFLLISLATALAQSPCQPILSQAQVALNRGNTEQALRKLQHVEICDDSNVLIQQRQRLQNAIFSLINQQKQEALDARAEADRVLALIEEEKQRTLSALNRAQKLVDAFYFYDGKFALAFKDNRFYFIDKQGDKVEKMGSWVRAEHFDRNGYAKVSNGKNESFWLDTTGQVFVPANTFSELKRSSEIAYFHTYNGEIDELTRLLERSPNLKRLSISVSRLGITDNQIEPLFAVIAKMRKLEYLSLDSRMSFIPASIGQLKSLKYLHLGGNRLTEIPPEIGQLKELKMLNVGFNSITTLPPEIGQLNKLEKLYLTNNSISELPDELANLSVLKQLNLESNGIDEEKLQVWEKRMPWCRIRIFNRENLLSQYRREKNYPALYKIYQEEMTVERPDNPNYWHNLSFYALFVGEYKTAISAAQRALELNPNGVGVETNLALGYVLNDEWPKAEIVYLRWKEKNFPNDPRTTNDVFLNDIENLEAAGITHPDFAKVRALFEH